MLIETIDANAARIVAGDPVINDNSFISLSYYIDIVLMLALTGSLDNRR